MSETHLVTAQMIDGVLYVQASDYQLAETKYAVLSAEYDKLSDKHVALNAELLTLRTLLDDTDS